MSGSNKESTEISIVAPMHNEVEGLYEFFSRVSKILDSCSNGWEIICIDDGSTDETLSELKKLHKKDSRIKVLSLSRNFGKEIALSAGLQHASGKAIIPIDSDLQDPPELIPEMIEKWKEGFKVVLATRINRKSDSFLKRSTASLFYKLIKRLSPTHIPENTGDFRLMDRKVLEAINSFPERTRFMKGLFAWAGFSTTYIYYERPKRAAGEASQNYKKLFNLAVDGILSFSTIPLRIWTFIGAFVSLASFLYATFLIFRTLVFGADVPGYASIMVAILFMGGIQLISLGIIGEYIGRIYRETKHRPLYILQESIGFEDDKK